MSFLIDEQVFGFEVSIDDILAVHVAEGEQYLADVEHGDIIAESTIFSEAVEELPSGAVLEDHVDEDLILE